MGDPGWENIAIWCYRNAYRQSQGSTDRIVRPDPKGSISWSCPLMRPDYLVIGRTGSWIPGQSGDGNLKIMIGNLYLKTEQWTLALSSFKEALKYLPPELGNEALKESFLF